MGHPTAGNRFFITIGLILFAFVCLGFGSAAIERSQNPIELPMLYHIHGVSYLLWFTLFATQAALISKENKRLHMTLGKWSPCSCFSNACHWLVNGTRVL